MISSLNEHFKIPVSQLCSLFKVSRSSYYYSKNIVYSKKYINDSELKNELNSLYNKHQGVYGYRRLAIEYNRNNTNYVNVKRVHRLCQQMNLQAKIRLKRRYTKGKKEYISENILSQNFYASKPAEKWVIDITQANVDNKKHYLCAVMDLFNREVVGYSIGENETTELVKKALIESFSNTKEATNTLIHSDQGSQFTSIIYKDLLREHNSIQSHSRAGNCLDNAMIENFFSHLKSEFLYNNKIKSKEMLYEGINKYIFYYNNIRIQNKTKMTPLEIKEVYLNNKI